MRIMLRILIISTMTAPSPPPPRGAANARNTVSCKLLLFTIAAIASAGHLLLSSSELERSLFEDAAELWSMEYAYDNNESNRIQQQEDELKKLKQEIKSLESRLERRAKTTDLIQLEQRLDSRNSTTHLASLLHDSNDEFCMPWHVPMDDWWTHHVDWEMGRENATHYCFQRIRNAEKVSFLRRLYDTQFTSDCSKVVTKYMLNAGLGADLDHMVDGILFGLQHNRPFQVYRQGKKKPWHYAARSNGSRATCPTKDFYCYFLNISNCAPTKQSLEKGPFLTHGYNKQFGIGRWMLEYIARPQTWLRRAVYEFVQTRIKLSTPCTVFHVRRADIVLHGNWSRRYRPIEEYVQAAKNHSVLSHQNILLLTDDANAIDEALAQFPDYHWMYIQRKRHRGTEGGFENQIPSQNPQEELIILLSILQLVQQCSALVHTTGNFAELLWGEMDSRSTVARINLDELDTKHDLFSANNSRSVHLSKASFAS